ncbi:MAG: orotate phosphoribosyltransferase [Lachnospiraceae bacterium]|nr:orotate phosphoribosyltransferase [Lachnospiraceae bacterium]
MSREELAKSIYEKSYMVGKYVMQSGKVSNEYFDKYLFESDPKLLMDIATQMKELLPEDTEVLAGIEMGGIPVVTALSILSGKKATYVRKHAKQFGTYKLAEGADVKGKRVCMIEDVVTNSGEIIETVKKLRNRGAIIDTVVCVIARNQHAKLLLAHEQLTLIPIFTQEDILKEKMEK